MTIKMILVLVCTWLLTTSVAVAGTPVITGIAPKIVTPGDMVTITGENFGKDIILTLTVEAPDDKEIHNIASAEKSDKQVKFIVPILKRGSSKAIITLRSDNHDVKPAVAEEAGKSNPLELCIYSSLYIREAVLWKGMPQSATLEHIAKLMQRATDNGVNSETLFHGVPIIGGDLKMLTDAGYDSESIQKLEGLPQYATVGMSGILLTKANDLVAAPILRIFIKPRSYFRQRVPFWTRDYTLSQWMQGVLERTDLNLGYTVVKAKADKNSANVTETNFMLAGLSYEINKAALLNAGWAVPVNSGVKEKGQFYLGVTVDFNLLKELKMFEK